MKIKLRIPKNKNVADYEFYCPACKTIHYVWTTESEMCAKPWFLTGTLTKPTINPSLSVIGDIDGKQTKCHFFVWDGKIKYLSDCTHDMKGQIVDMVDIDKF